MTISRKIQVISLQGEQISLTIESIRGTRQVPTNTGWNLEGITPEKNPDFFNMQVIYTDTITAYTKFGDAEVRFFRKAYSGPVFDKYGKDVDFLSGNVFYQNRRRPIAIVVDKESGNLIEQTLKEVQEESEHDTDYFEYKKEENMPRLLDTIKAGNAEIKNSGKLMSRKEIEAVRKRYNEVANEGGEGFVPSFISIESYENAKKDLEKYNNK